MINPTSLRLRRLYPLESHPALLRGWRCVFRGDCGMASILPADSTLPSMNNHPIPRNDFHGVLHRLDEDMMARLDIIESAYERLTVEVELYDGRRQKATVYKMYEAKLDPMRPDTLPSERYLDIISKGCEHFGVSREYIEWLRGHECVPRKDPATYRKIPVHRLHQSGKKHLNLTAEELAKYDGKTLLKEGSGDEIDEGGDDDISSLKSPPPAPPSPSRPRYYPLRIAINRKVLEWVGDTSQPLLANTYEFMSFNFGGTDLTHSYTRVFYEPLYPTVDKLDDMSHEHRAWVEDLFYDKVCTSDRTLREWQLVGFLSMSEQKSSAMSGMEKLRKNRARSSSIERIEEMDLDGNIFHLGLEDHSGQSSSCFAFCCVSAQPFYRQRMQALLDRKKGGVGGPLHRSTRNTSKMRHAERKRRHSIDNVGLHQAAAHKATQSNAAAQSSSQHHDFHTAHHDSHSTASDASTTAACSCATCTCSTSDSDSAAHVATSHASSHASPSSHVPSLALAAQSLPSRIRSASICNGTLATLHAMQSSATGTGSRGGSSVTYSLQSPRRRINSADESMLSPTSNANAMSPEGAGSDSMRSQTSTRL